MAYSELICNCRNIDDIINNCHEAIPLQYKAKPWTFPELNHGIDLLSSENALNCYMSAYGDMHVTKCRAAMMNFPFLQLQGSIEIVDWGCGQGIGSATIVDVLRQHDLLQWIRKITLIEPSGQALMRAVQNIKQITNNSVEIDSRNKFLPSKGVDKESILESFGYKYTNIIHIFSNILDVLTIDLGAVANMVASSHGKHFILCVGPQNSAAYRIERFCAMFGDQEYFSKIDSTCFGRTKRTAHSFTCMTRCCNYNGTPIDLSRQYFIPDNNEEAYNEYDLRLQIQNKVLSPQKARVAWRLQNILSVDDIMYIDAVVNEVVVDFIIIRPSKGLILVNLFDENLDNCKLYENEKGNKKEEKYKKDIIANDKKYKSPFNLISLCQSSVKDGIEELLISTIEDVRNFSVIKKVLVFPENSIVCVKKFFDINSNCIDYTYFYGNEFIKNREVSLQLYKTIGILRNQKAFDDIVKRKLVETISPSWHSFQEGRIGMQPVGPQRMLSESSMTQQKISGVAGSGKTQVLAFRAINAMKRTGGDVLVLTYNITLANYLKYRLSEIREDFSWEKIDIYPYHQFFRIRAAECNLHIEFTSYEDEGFFSKNPKHKKYAAIFIDEVQDYTTEWLRIIMQNFLLEPNGEIAVFGDPKQNVYQRPLDSNGDIRLGVIGGTWNRQLTTSRRFTNPRLANLSMSFQAKFMATNNIDNITTDANNVNSLNFQIITYTDIRGTSEIGILVGKITEIISNSNNEARDFVVLASSTGLLRDIDYYYRQQTKEKTETTFIPKENLKKLKDIHHIVDERETNWKFNRDFEALERTRKQLFTTDRRCLKISTIQSFKGWESPSVIVILEKDLMLNGTTFHPLSPETIYTAITRAREDIHIINVGNDSYHDFFYRQSL